MKIVKYLQKLFINVTIFTDFVHGLVGSLQLDLKGEAPWEGRRMGREGGKGERRNKRGVDGEGK